MSDTRASIVVGVDDTEAGRAALAFAMTEATRRGSALDVVTAWTSRSMTEATGIDDRESDRAHAQVVQDGAVAGALRGMAGSPTLSRQVVEGDAASVLLRLARKAAYLVVGAGQGAFDERGSLGSVTAQCVRAARCPVLVVPRPKQRNDNRNDNRKVKQ
jgi:nucleotide-binding universal stress UspA family protein